MTVEILLWTWSGFFWGTLSLAAFLLGLLLILLILFQDSKDTGLTSAFGGGGSSALMGARMQKDLAKLTAIFAAALAICLVLMGRISRFQTDESFGTVGAGGAPPAAAPAFSGALPTDSSPSGGAPGLPLDPLSAPIIPAPGGDTGGFPGLGSIPPGAISAPGDAPKSGPESPKAPEVPAKAPEAPAKAPEAGPPATNTSPAPTPQEKAPTAPPGDAGGTPPPASR
jgi:protein translocase SecG subunit